MRLSVRERLGQLTRWGARLVKYRVSAKRDARASSTKRFCADRKLFVRPSKARLKKKKPSRPKKTSSKGRHYLRRRTA